MEKYNYLDHIKEDVIAYLNENHDEMVELFKQNREDFAEKLNEDLWIEDSVTGNASGSYTCNAWQAEEYLAHNWDLLADAIEEFGGNTDILRQGPEVCDVTIRCYLLGQAIELALDEW